MPVEREQRGESLAYQVWVAAGLFILVGIFMGYALHPAFYALPAAAGAALLLTGLRDDNSLEAVLSHMPWNRDTKDGPKPAS